MHGGDTRDQGVLVGILADFAAKHHLTHVKVSIPEEKAYLFQTDVPPADMSSIRQNIESKLEENVPLAARDALFYFDLMPSATGALATEASSQNLSASQSLRASVSVVPRTYIEHLIFIVESAGLSILAFEVVPRALAQALLPSLSLLPISPTTQSSNSSETVMLVHLMNKKTAIYMVYGGIVCFTSTLSHDERVGDDRLSAADLLTQETNRIHEYWLTRPGARPATRILLIGENALSYEKELAGRIIGISAAVSVPHVWDSVLGSGASSGSVNVPQINREDSLTYAVAAGLALSS